MNHKYSTYRVAQHMITLHHANARGSTVAKLRIAHLRVLKRLNSLWKDARALPSGWEVLVVLALPWCPDLCGMKYLARDSADLLLGLRLHQKSQHGDPVRSSGLPSTRRSFAALVRHVFSSVSGAVTTR